MTRLDRLGEREILKRLVPPGRAGHGVIVGSGDDAAILRVEPGFDLVATTDAFVEHRHFARDLIDPRRLGARLATANLSDLAAMAARPRWAMLSFGVRPDTDVEWLEDVQRGFDAAIGVHGAVVVGGNLAAVDGPEWLDASLLGACARGAAWTRSGARAGDALLYSGTPGSAAAGLELLRRLGPPAADAWWTPLHRAWAEPSARVDLALSLAPLGVVRAAIDRSDGFAMDLRRLCEASEVGAEIETLDLSPELERAAHELGVDPWSLQIGASDDYELILAVDPAGMAGALATAERCGVRLVRAGRITAAAGSLVGSRDGAFRELPDVGWDPFGG